MRVLATDPTPDFSTMSMDQILQLPKVHLQSYLKTQGKDLQTEPVPSVVQADPYKGHAMLKFSHGTGSKPFNLSVRKARTIVALAEQIQALTDPKPIEVPTGEA